MTVTHNSSFLINYDLVMVFFVIQYFLSLMKANYTFLFILLIKNYSITS